VSLTVLFYSFEDVIARQRLRVRGRGGRSFGIFKGGFAVHECVHHVVDLLRIDNSLTAPVLEYLGRIFVSGNVQIMDVEGRTCLVLVRFGRPCLPSGTTHSIIIRRSRATKST